LTAGSQVQILKSLAIAPLGTFLKNMASLIKNLFRVRSFNSTVDMKKPNQKTIGLVAFSTIGLDVDH
jgi:hypothetical protein